MSEPIEDPDINLVSVTTTSSIFPSGSNIDIVVSVTSNIHAFQDESAYRLFVFLCCCHGSHESTPPIILTGHHLGDSTWPTQNHDFKFSVKADECPDVCTVTAVLLEGGVHDTDSLPIIKVSAPFFIVCPA